jgi:hypothetical protein
MHGRDEPVRQREARQQRQRAMRRTKAFFTPPDVGQAEMVSPVIRFERHSAPCCRQRIDVATRAIEHESKRGPCLAVIG